jgi:catechol O-methyltransferase
MESENLLRKGSVLVADNILFPGAPEYAKYVRTSKKYQSTFHKSTLEYIEEVEDGVEVSIYLSE